jgi:hypothetical protein
MFVPATKNPANAKRSKFCCKKCKDGFHRHGGLNLAQFQELVGKRVLRQLQTDEDFIAAISGRIGSMVRELAREEIAAASALRR